jgi:hypothetical protein
MSFSNSFGKRYVLFQFIWEKVCPFPIHLGKGMSFSNSFGKRFVPKKERDLLSLISLGIEFQRNSPSYIKLFFKLLVCGYGKQRVLEIFFEYYS